MSITVTPCRMPFCICATTSLVWLPSLLPWSTEVASKSISPNPSSVHFLKGSQGDPLKIHTWSFPHSIKIWQGPESATPTYFTSLILCHSHCIFWQQTSHLYFCSHNTILFFPPQSICTWPFLCLELVPPVSN